MTRRSRVATSTKIARERCRAEVYERDQRRCRGCGTLLSLHMTGPLPVAQMHEMVPRSHGGSESDPRNVVTLCASCHGAVGMCLGGRRVVITPLTAEGANGNLRFETWMEYVARLGGETSRTPEAKPTNGEETR